LKLIKKEMPFPGFAAVFVLILRGKVQQADGDSPTSICRSSGSWPTRVYASPVPYVPEKTESERSVAVVGSGTAG